jgi:hypothetical protein
LKKPATQGEAPADGSGSVVKPTGRVKPLPLVPIVRTSV